MSDVCLVLDVCQSRVRTTTKLRLRLCEKSARLIACIFRIRLLCGRNLAASCASIWACRWIVTACVRRRCVWLQSSRHIYLTGEMQHTSELLGRRVSKCGNHCLCLIGQFTRTLLLGLKLLMGTNCKVCLLHASGLGVSKVTASVSNEYTVLRVVIPKCVCDFSVSCLVHTPRHICAAPGCQHSHLHLPQPPTRPVASHLPTQVFLCPPST